MPVGVGDRGVAVAVGLVGPPVEPGPGAHRRRGDGVHVGDVEDQAHRDAARVRRGHPDLRVLVGEVDHPVRQFQLGMAHPPVRHDDRLTAQPRAEHPGVPVQGVPGPAHREVRNGGAAVFGRCRRLAPGQGQGCLGHGDSFG